MNRNERKLLNDSQFSSVAATWNTLIRQTAYAYSYESKLMEVAVAAAGHAVWQCGILSNVMNVSCSLPPTCQLDTPTRAFCPSLNISTWHIASKVSKQLSKSKRRFIMRFMVTRFWSAQCRVRHSTLTRSITVVSSAGTPCILNWTVQFSKDETSNVNAP